MFVEESGVYILLVEQFCVVETGYLKQKEIVETSDARLLEEKQINKNKHNLM